MHFPLEMQIFLLFVDGRTCNTVKNLISPFSLLEARLKRHNRKRRNSRENFSQTKTPRMSRWSLQTLNINKRRNRLKLIWKSEISENEKLLRKIPSLFAIRNAEKRCCVAQVFHGWLLRERNFLSQSIVYEGTKTFGAIEPCCYTSHNHFPKLGN